VSFLLPALLAPLLASVAIERAHRPAAAARMIFVSFALATLDVGTGSVAVDELRSWAALGDSQRLFVSLSTGLALGALGWWYRRGWRWHLVTLPLALALVLVFGRHLRPLPLVLGGVLGALPLLLGGLAPRTQSRRSPEAATVRWAHLLLALAAGLLVFLAAHLVPQLSSESAERGVGAGVLLAAAVMIAPWPLHRWGLGALLVPAALVLVWRVAGTVAPVGIAEASTLLAQLLVPSAILAAWRGHWAVALATVGILAAPQAGWLGLGVVLLGSTTVLVLTRHDLRTRHRISFPAGTLDAVLFASAASLCVAVVIRHEVVLGALLAAGITAAVARPTWRSAAA
jgi:hypothetical protein